MYDDLVLPLELELEQDPLNHDLDVALAELKHSILRIAASLPASSIPNFAAKAIPSLRPYTPKPVLIALLSALFSWNFHEQLFQMISSWITNLSTGRDEPLDEGKPYHLLQLPTLVGSEDLIEETKFGLSLLDMIFENSELRASLISNASSISSVIHSLYPHIRIIESRLTWKDEHSFLSHNIPDSILLATVDLYYRLMMHVGAASSEQVTTLNSFR
jgi:hypothetical protein